MVKSIRGVVVDKFTKSIEQRAIEIVNMFEKVEGRNPINVSKKGVGYDINSDGRMIEVKGVGESWKTYNWQRLYPSGIECLNRNTTKFYLYIRLITK